MNGAIQSAFMALLNAIEAEGEALRVSLQQAVSEGDMSALQRHQARLKSLLAFRSVLLKAYRRWQEE